MAGNYCRCSGKYSIEKHTCNKAFLCSSPTAPYRCLLYIDIYFFKVLVCKISIQRKSSKHKNVKICFHVRSSVLKFMAGHCGLLKCLRTSHYPAWKLLHVLLFYSHSTSNHTNVAHTSILCSLKNKQQPAVQHNAWI